MRYSGALELVAFWWLMKRTPRHYNGPMPTGKKLSDLLPEMMKGIRGKAGDRTEEIFQYWPVLIGEKMASMTEAVSFVEGVLTVKVKSSTLYSLLTLHERPRLLRALNEKFSVRSLVFRVG
jgi:hypothetical protein